MNIRKTKNNKMSSIALEIIQKTELNTDTYSKEWFEKLIAILSPMILPDFVKKLLISGVTMIL